MSARRLRSYRIHLIEGFCDNCVVEVKNSLDSVRNVNTTYVPDQLRLLSLIKRHGTLGAAAEILGITAAAATQRLAKAERDWGTTLVIRSSKRTRLTPAGLVLAPFGDVVNRQAIDALEAFQAFQGFASQRLRIGTFHTLALHLLPPVLSALRDTDPGADISVTDIVSGEAIDLVFTGALDVAIFATRNESLVQPPEVIVEHVMTDPMFIVLPEDHPLAQETDVPLTLDRLRNEKWVLLGASHAAREQFNQAAAEAGFSPHIQCETESHDVAQALVASGIGVAMVSHLALNSTPGTVARPFVQPKVERQILVATPRDRSLSPLTNALVRHLLDVSQTIEKSWENSDGSLH